MFNVRKSLVIAITVVMMLAMVVPAAMAAPEDLHGIIVTSEHPQYSSVAEVEVAYTLTIVKDQVDDVKVRAKVLDLYGNKVGEESFLHPNADLNAGEVDGELTVDFTGAEGWYDIEVCAKEKDSPEEVWNWCVLVENAVLFDETDPKVWLDKPASVWSDDPEDGVWLTGTEYLVGGAEDEGGLDKTTGVFEYCALSNYLTNADEVDEEGKCGPDDTSWIPAVEGAVTCTVNEYGGTEFAGYWDTNRVPDDEGVIRFCVTDLAGNEKCSDNPVWIDNEFDLHLYPGWNLISTPLMLYDADIEAVLHHLLVANKVEAVLAYDASCGSCGWTSFTPDNPAPDTLKAIDHGKGYWVFMRGEGELELEGTWKSVAWETPTPAAYPVVKGWNLIGYTQWGRPTAPFFDASFAADYLANIMTPIPGVGGGVQALVKYNAATGLYKAVEYWDRMEMGKGYWLATDTAGTIVPAQW